MRSNERPEDKYLRRLAQMKVIRRPWEDEWKNVTHFIFPRRNIWTMAQKGQKGLEDDVYDTVALEALTLQSDGLISNLVPMGLPFFKFQPQIVQFSKYRPLRMLLDQYAEQITGNINVSNFDLDNGEAFPDACGLGTSVTYMEEDPSSHRLMLSSRHIKECYIAENRFGIVDTLYREFEMSRENLVEQFEKELDEKMKKRADDQPDSTVKVLHVVAPVGNEFEEVYLLPEENANDKEKFLYTGSRERFPYAVWRYRKNSDEPYGRSPAMDAYWEVSMINHQSKTMAEAAHKAVDPPLIASIGLHGRINQNPRAITYKTTPSDTVQQLYGNGMAQYPLGIDAMERRADIIRKHFRYSLFQNLLMDPTVPGRERTATEINAIEAQKASILGSTIGRIQKERLEPIIGMFFHIEDKAGRLPPISRELRQFVGLGITTEYIGPLAKRLRQYLSSQGIVEGFQYAANIAQIKPETLDNYDMDWISTQGAKLNGLPEEALIDPKIVQKVRQVRAEQQAAMQQAALEIEQAKAAPGLTKAPEPGSPADRMGNGR